MNIRDGIAFYNSFWDTMIFLHSQTYAFIYMSMDKHTPQSSKNYNYTPARKQLPISRCSMYSMFSKKTLYLVDSMYSIAWIYWLYRTYRKHTSSTSINWTKNTKEWSELKNQVFDCGFLTNTLFLYAI